MGKKVIVIGGGLAGLSGAIRLAKMGFSVTLFEKNKTLGGKMNEVAIDDYRFDIGPSLLTMPFVVDDIFKFSGYNRNTFLEYEKIDPICRYFFADGTMLNASSNEEKMITELEKLSTVDGNNYSKFLKYSKKIYDLTADLFLFKPIHELKNILRLKNLATLFNIRKIDPFRNVHQSISNYFEDERIVQLFDRYATYNGSNPFQAPATLNIIPYVEYGLGGFYVKGGMYRLIESLNTLANNLNIKLEFETEVEKILENNGKVTGVQINNEKIDADYVLCNMDVVEAFNKLIDGHKNYTNKLNKLEPSLSGMVFLWGIKKQNGIMAHHNIFFSDNYKKEFDEIFKNHSAPSEPTIYVSITSKSDQTHAPENCENWFVLLNMPYLVERQDWVKEVNQQRDKIFRRLQKEGLTIEENIEVEDVFTPEDFYSMYNSNKGSIYGISSNNRNTAFKRPANRNRQIENLYFAGGSTHPGGGIPLTLLSGKIASELIAEKEGIVFN